MTSNRYRVVIAPDEFGGTLAAADAARAVELGWRRCRPDDVLDLLPQSDGGPGFVEVLAAAGIGDRTPVQTLGPMGEPVLAELLLDGETAYVESAQACGLHLLESGPSPETAWTANSAGVGVLLSAAIDAGARRIVVGLGGSATTDGGRGACEALGGLPRARALFAPITLVAATDVTNVLLGPGGAASVFGPQKGADAETVARLEQRLLGWAADLESDGQRRRDLPGAGAAGGLGALLLTLGARRRSGADVVAEATGRAQRIGAADLVITGEGRYDAQTAFGKVIASVAADARRAGVPVVVVAGQVEPGVEIDGVTTVLSLSAAAGSVDRAFREPAAVLADVAEDLARTWSRSG